MGRKFCQNSFAVDVIEKCVFVCKKKKKLLRNNVSGEEKGDADEEREEVIEVTGRESEIDTEWGFRREGIDRLEKGWV